MYLPTSMTLFVLGSILSTTKRICGHGSLRGGVGLSVLWNTPVCSIDDPLGYRLTVCLAQLDL